MRETRRSIRSFGLWAAISGITAAGCDSAGTGAGTTAGVDAVVGGDVPTLNGDATTVSTSTNPPTGSPDATATTATTHDSTTTEHDTSTGTTTHPMDTMVHETTVTDTGTPGDTTTPPTGAVGSSCASASDCEGPDAVCLGFPGGYCTKACAPGCPNGSTCYTLGSQGDFCIEDCAGPSDCRTGEGYVCDADNTCWYYETGTGTAPVGGACEADGDCKDAGAFCYPADLNGTATGFFNGYCMIEGCTANSCPVGSRCEAIFSGGGTACVASCGAGGAACNQGYACFDPGVCFPGCATSGCPTNYACDATDDYCVPACTANSCPQGTVCHADGTCGDPPCQEAGCEAGYACTPSGACVPDISGGPGAGPGPECPSLPTRDCVGTAAYCGELIQFDPNLGTGYWDYAINGETDVTDEYRSWSRRDLQMLIKWASAVVDCKAKSWLGGNGKPIGLGDMSEKNGAIPGAREGDPGHPEGTHEMGYDTDFAYFQTSAAPDNKLRPICTHTSGGADAYHCTAAPTTLDLWRSAMILGTMMTSGRVRVIGVDGKVGPLMEQAIDVLCGNGWVSGPACSPSRPLAYEVTDTGRGWFRFHHHHMHISFEQVASGAPSLVGTSGREQCLTPGCGELSAVEAGQCLVGDGKATSHWRAHRELLPVPARIMKSGHEH